MLEEWVYVEEAVDSVMVLDGLRWRSGPRDWVSVVEVLEEF